MRRLLVLLLMVLAVPASAALVDAEFDSIRGTPIAQLFINALAPASDPSHPDPPPASKPLPDLARVLVGWNGVHSPPVIRFIGLAAKDVVPPLAHGAAPTATPVGPSWPLPNLSGFWIAIAGDRDLLVSTPAQLAHLKPSPIPPGSGHAMRFTGPATDLKLGDLQSSLRCFVMTYDSDGTTKATLFANSEKDAKHVDRYIWWRKPIVYAGADLGVTKLKFPAHLLDQTDISRDKDQLIASTNLHDDLRAQAFQVLADQIQKELRNFQPK